VTSAHFDAAFARVQPSVSSADQRRYDELRRKLRKERGSIAAPGLDREEGANVGRGSEGGMTLEPGPGEDGVGRRAGSAKKRKA
jgi:ribosome biogenesis ATPase